MFDYNVSRCGFLWVYPLWSLLNLESVGFFLSFFLGSGLTNFLTLVSLDGFSALLPFSCCLGLGICECCICLCPVHTSRRPCSVVFQSVFSLLFRLGNSCCYVFRFIGSFPVLFFFRANSEVLFQVLFFFGSKISVWFCLYIFCLCCDLLFFFVSDVFVLAHWNVLWWLLKSYLLILLSVSSQCWHYWSSFLFSLEIFLVPAMMRVVFFYWNLHILIIISKIPDLT